MCIALFSREFVLYISNWRGIESKYDSISSMHRIMSYSDFNTFLSINQMAGFIKFFSEIWVFYGAVVCQVYLSLQQIFK